MTSIKLEYIVSRLNRLLEIDKDLLKEILAYRIKIRNDIDSFIEIVVRQVDSETFDFTSDNKTYILLGSFFGVLNGIILDKFKENSSIIVLHCENNSLEPIEFRLRENKDYSITIEDISTYLLKLMDLDHIFYKNLFCDKLFKLKEKTQSELTGKLEDNSEICLMNFLYDFIIKDGGVA